MCFDFFYKFFSETFLILRGIRRDIINVRTVHRSSCQVPVFLAFFMKHACYLYGEANSVRTKL